MAPPRPPPDDALWALFAAELEGHTRTLGDWVRSGMPLSGGAVPVPVQRAVHSMKGATRVVEADPISKLADALERALASVPSLAPVLLPGASAVLHGTCEFLQRLSRAKRDVPGFAQEHAAELTALHAAISTLAIADSLGPDEAGEGRGAAGAVAPDPAMLELFRAEIEQCATTLSDGLLTLEGASPNAEDWELWMRAAHSVKGAARILHLDAMARLAHWLEECLLRARSGQLVLDGGDVDVLLQAVDATRSAARVLSERVRGGRAQVETAAAAIAERLSALARRRKSVSRLPVPAPPPPAAVVAPSPPAALAAPSPPAPRLSIPSVVFNKDALIEFGPVSRPPRPAQAAPVPDLPAPPPRMSQPPQARTRPDSGPRGADRVLRVAIDSIERLLGLAGESLVESRRMASLARSLQRARRQQAGLAECLANLDRLLEGSGNAPAQAALLDARNRARECTAWINQHGAALEHYVRHSEELGENIYREALKSRMRPFSDGTRGFSRLVRDLARQLGKRVRLQIVGEATEVDRDALDGLEGPLNHLLRNAIDHGIEAPDQRASCGKPEQGIVRIEARHHAGMLSVSVSDDGRGLSPETIRAQVVRRGLTNPGLAANLTAGELFEFLFLPGFSTAASVSEISGRGVGLDVVKTSVEALGGSVRASSEPGRGSSFHMLLPVTRSVVRAVVADVAGDSYAFPLLRIDRLDRVALGSLRRLENRPYMLIDGQPVALVAARDVLGLSGSTEPQALLNVIVVSDRTRRFGITVDALRGEHDLVVRPLDTRLGKVQDIAAAAVLDDGSPALIVDVDDVLRSIERRVQSQSDITLSAPLEGMTPAARKRVLVVDDSIMVREAERQLLLNRGFEVDTAVDGIDGLNSVRRGHYDLVITDIDMPRMNGIELVRSIKQDAKLSAIPIVIVSYKDREEDRLLGLEAGATYYLSKSSFHDDRLVEAVEDLIGAVS